MQSSAPPAKVQTGRPPPLAERRGNEASRLPSRGAFFCGPAQTPKERTDMAEIEKELRHYLEGDVEPRAALEWSRETSAAMVDLKLCDLLGSWQHVSLPVGSLAEA